MSITYHRDLIQGSDEWLAARCGLLTASEMKLIITPTLKVASNEKERAHLYELLAQRITRYVEPTYISDDMLRGRDDEIEARALYAQHYAPVEEVGFITRAFTAEAEPGLPVTFTLGYSPDGLVGDDGLIECKSRRQKFQIETLIGAPSGAIPDDFVLQVQTGLLVTGRRWCDFVSYCGGLPMAVVRVMPDDLVQGVILTAAAKFEERLQSKRSLYEFALGLLKTVPTERRIEQEMMV